MTLLLADLGLRTAVKYVAAAYAIVWLLTILWVSIVQSKLRPGLCAVNPDKPLQYGEMAWLLPRGDAAFKAWMDQWLHLAKASGEYDGVVGRWLR